MLSWRKLAKINSKIAFSHTKGNALEATTQTTLDSPFPSHPHSNSCISISFYFSYFHIFANLFYTFAEIAMHFKCGIHKMHLPQTFK